jgi:tRNA1(Val) A37 N6-methylase TrmN6
MRLRRGSKPLRGAFARAGSGANFKVSLIAASAGTRFIGDWETFFFAGMGRCQCGMDDSDIGRESGGGARSARSAGSIAGEPAPGGRLVLPGEDVEDLQCGGLRIIQSRSAFRFGMDAVLLANFAKAKNGAHVVELCAGSGVVSMLMAAKTGASKFTGVEIQESLAGMANRSAALNGLGGKAVFLRADLREYRDLFKKGAADAVVANPPYVKNRCGIKNRDPGVAIARHEICCTLGDVMEAASYLLRDGGDLFMAQRPNRLADVCCSARAFGLEPKYIQMAHSKLESPPVLMLVHAKKASGAELKFMPPIRIP